MEPRRIGYILLICLLFCYQPTSSSAVTFLHPDTLLEIFNIDHLPSASDPISQDGISKSNTLDSQALHQPPAADVNMLGIKNATVSSDSQGNHTQHSQSKDAVVGQPSVAQDNSSDTSQMSTENESLSVSESNQTNVDHTSMATRNQSSVNNVTELQGQGLSSQKEITYSANLPTGVTKHTSETVATDTSQNLNQNDTKITSINANGSEDLTVSNNTNVSDTTLALRTSEVRSIQKVHYSQNGDLKGNGATEQSQNNTTHLNTLPNVLTSSTVQSSFDLSNQITRSFMQGIESIKVFIDRKLQNINDKLVTLNHVIQENNRHIEQIGITHRLEQLQMQQRQQQSQRGKSSQQTTNLQQDSESLNQHQDPQNPNRQNQNVSTEQGHNLKQSNESPQQSQRKTQQSNHRMPQQPSQHQNQQQQQQELRYQEEEQQHKGNQQNNHSQQKQQAADQHERTVKPSIQVQYYRQSPRQPRQPRHPRQQRKPQQFQQHRLEQQIQPQRQEHNLKYQQHLPMQATQTQTSQQKLQSQRLNQEEYPVPQQPMQSSDRQLQFPERQQLLQSYQQKHNQQQWNPLLSHQQQVRQTPPSQQQQQMYSRQGAAANSYTKYQIPANPSPQTFGNRGQPASQFQLPPYQLSQSHSQPQSQFRRNIQSKSVSIPNNYLPVTSQQISGINTDFGTSGMNFGMSRANTGLPGLFVPGTEKFPIPSPLTSLPRINQQDSYIPGLSPLLSSSSQLPGSGHSGLLDIIPPGTEVQGFLTSSGLPGDRPPTQETAHIVNKVLNILGSNTTHPNAEVLAEMLTDMTTNTGRTAG